MNLEVSYCWLNGSMLPWLLTYTYGIFFQILTQLSFAVREKSLPSATLYSFRRKNNPEALGRFLSSHQVKLNLMPTFLNPINGKKDQDYPGCCKPTVILPLDLREDQTDVPECFANHSDMLNEEPKAENHPKPADSKGMRTSVLQSNGTEFCLNELAVHGPPLPTLGLRQEQGQSLS